MNGIVAHPRRQVNSRHSAPRRYHEPRRKRTLYTPMPEDVERREIAQKEKIPVSALSLRFIRNGIEEHRKSREEGTPPAPRP